MKQAFAKRMILITIICMDLLTGMEFDLFVPSFPQLQTHFGLSPFWVEALLSVNFIGYCLSLFFVGSLADRYGRKPIILLGLMTVCYRQYPLFMHRILYFYSRWSLSSRHWNSGTVNFKFFNYRRLLSA